MEKVVVGQLVHVVDSQSVKMSVVTYVYDDRFIVLFGDGGGRVVFTDEALKKDLVERGIITGNTRVLPLYKNEEPVMSGVLKIGLFKKREYYTLKPV